MADVILLYLWSIFSVFPLFIFAYDGTEKDCPAPCLCSGAMMNCNDQALVNWPTDNMNYENKDSFQLYIRDNFLSTVPVDALKSILPALEFLDISGNTIACSDVSCLESTGLTVFSDCRRGKNRSVKDLSLFQTSLPIS